MNTHWSFAGVRVRAEQPLHVSVERDVEGVGQLAARVLDRQRRRRGRPARPLEVEADGEIRRSEVLAVVPREARVDAEVEARRGDTKAGARGL